MSLYTNVKHKQMVSMMTGSTLNICFVQCSREPVKTSQRREVSVPLNVASTRGKTKLESNFFFISGFTTSRSHFSDELRHYNTRREERDIEHYHPWNYQGNVCLTRGVRSVVDVEWKSSIISDYRTRFRQSLMYRNCFVFELYIETWTKWV